MIHGHNRVVTAPQQEPVTLAELKEWCRYYGTDQDYTLLLLARAMRGYAENLTGRAFIRRDLEQIFDCFPCRVIYLPQPPLASVASIIYLDTDGTLQTLTGSPSQFQVDTDHEPGRVWPLYQESWPSTLDELNAVRIRFTAGYIRSQVPAEFKLWVQARIATLFEQREQLITGTIVNDIPRAFADGLLDGLITADRIAG